MDAAFIAGLGGEGFLPQVDITRENPGPATATSAGAAAEGHGDSLLESGIKNGAIIAAGEGNTVFKHDRVNHHRSSINFHPQRFRQGLQGWVRE
jgi:hypothetical protein